MAYLPLSRDVQEKLVVAVGHGGRNAHLGGLPVLVLHDQGHGLGRTADWLFEGIAEVEIAAQ